MKSLDIDFLSRQAIPIEMGGLLQKLGEYKGRQDLFQHQTPQVLKTLKQAAIIESTESSNRIEGVTVPAKRFKELMAHLSSKGWHEAKHSLKPWWEYSLGVLIGAYQEFERRIGSITKARGAKTSIIKEAIQNLPETFSISDLERLCPSVSRDMIRVILNRLRKEGSLSCKGAGRGALWEKCGNKPSKRGNKGGTNGQ